MKGSPAEIPETDKAFRDDFRKAFLFLDPILKEMNEKLRFSFGLVLEV